LASLPKDEGSATQVAFDLCGDGVDRDLRSVEIFGGLSAVEQEIEETEQIVAGCVGVANLEVTLHPSTCLRRASSLR
jgi:hypothetical protein